MNRDSLLDPQSDQGTADSAAETDTADHGLPPAIHAYILRLNPADDVALSDLLLRHRALSSRILPSTMVMTRSAAAANCRSWVTTRTARFRSWARSRMIVRSFSLA